MIARSLLHADAPDADLVTTSTEMTLAFVVRTAQVAVPSDPSSSRAVLVRGHAVMLSLSAPHTRLAYTTGYANVVTRTVRPRPLAPHSAQRTVARTCFAREQVPGARRD